MSESITIRKCCRAGIYCGGRGVAALPTTDGGPSLWTGEKIKEIEIAPPPRDRGVALHEAGHAVVGFGVGFSVTAVTIDDQPSASLEAKNINSFDRICMLLAGEIAARWFARHIYRPPNETVLRYIAAVRSLDLGSCDHCQACLSAISAAGGAESSDDKILDVYREAEAATIEFVRQPNVWRAITRLTDELMETGTVDGLVARNIIEAEGIAFASLSSPIQDQPNA